MNVGFETMKMFSVIFILLPLYYFETVAEPSTEHDGRLLGLFLPEGSKSHFLARRGVVYILNEARH